MIMLIVLKSIKINLIICGHNISWEYCSIAHFDCSIYSKSVQNTTFFPIAKKQAIGTTFCATFSINFYLIVHNIINYFVTACSELCSEHAYTKNTVVEYH